MRLSSSFQSKPYEIAVDKNGLRFTTDRGLIYEIYFTGADKHFEGTSFSHQIFQFGFLPLSESTSSNLAVHPQRKRMDPRVMATVIDQVENWFYQYPVSVLAYTCSVTDEKQQARQRMFSELFSLYVDSIDEDYVMLRYDSGEGLLGAMLYRRGNPYEKDIMAFMGSDLTGKFYNKDWWT